MQDTINALLEWGYVLLFIYSLGGGMIGILAAGVLSATSELNLYACILIAFVANVIGSMLLFVMGRYYKKDLMPYFRKHRRKLALAQMKIKQHGTFLIIFQKFIYGLKTFVPIAAGFARYDLAKFTLINTLATALWAVLLGYIGFAFGSLIAPIVDKIGSYPYLVPLFLLALIGTLWLYLAKFSKKPKTTH